MKKDLSHSKTQRVLKNVIELLDGRKLPFYRPLPSKEKLELKSYIPENYKEIEVEIGCGTGRFMANRAPLYAERFFIGIDKKKERFDKTQEKLERQGLDNFKILRVDAKSFLEREIPPLAVMHVYHPDPWPKKRHHKNRFFRSPDAKHWASMIEVGGELRISTDQADYYEEILAIVESWGIFKLTLAAVKRSGKPASRFEEIFLSKGEPAYKAYYRRI